MEGYSVVSDTVPSPLIIFLLPGGFISFHKTCREDAVLVQEAHHINACTRAETQAKF